MPNLSEKEGRIQLSTISILLTSRIMRSYCTVLIPFDCYLMCSPANISSQKYLVCL